MATNVVTNGLGARALHYHLVSLNVPRYRAIRMRRAMAPAALVVSLALTGIVAGGVLTLAGAPLWLAAVIGLAVALIVPMRGRAVYLMTEGTSRAA